MINCDLPYIYHIGNVLSEVLFTLNNLTLKDGGFIDPDLCIQMAILHDVIEDTQLTCLQLLGLFDERVVDGILALTKNPEKGDKKSQLIDSIKRIKKQSYETWIVKMCDRIVNLTNRPSNWSDKKVKRYREESLIIWEELRECDVFLAKRLKEKIDSYS